MRRHLFHRLLFLLLLLSPVPASAEWSLSPPAIDNGGVSLLRWRGEWPGAATVRFNGREFPLLPAADGGLALLGADLETASGRYPVTVAANGPAGPRDLATLTLEIRAPRRPEERLTLPPAMVEPKDAAVLRRIEREARRLANLFAREEEPPLWRHFTRPVDDPLGSPFGLRRILNGKPRSPHAGVDFRSPRGTPVRAPAGGRVVLADDLYYTGRTVVLDHGAGLFSLYAHLEEILCAEGERLAPATILGRVGSTGRSTGPHLHWGVKLRGDRLDPLAIVSIFGEGKALDSPSGDGNN